MSNPKSKIPARLERRVRVTFFLVAETKEHREAIIDLIYYLGNQYLEPQFDGKSELPVTGFTHSAIHSGKMPYKGITLGKMFEKGIFWGHWGTEEKQEDTEFSTVKSIQERVVFFLIDFLAVAEEWQTDENIILLKNKIFKLYEEQESPQDEIWIVKQDIYRYA